MEVQPDSAISGQDATTQVDAGLGADGQEAGHVEDRVNGLMSSLGRRTTERDDAVAERDRLRAELAAMMAEPEPTPEAPGAAPPEAQLPGSTDEADEALAASLAPVEPPPTYELPAGSVVRTPDGNEYLVGSAGPGFIAPTSPRRTPSHQPETELEALRARFASELPTAVAEMRQRALLRGR